MSISGPTVKSPGTARLRGVVRAVNKPEPTGWTSDALCQTVDPDELFVQGAGQRKAVSLCRRCPVMYQCAAEALDNKVEFGVWGGMTERQRRAILKRHPDVVSWAAFLDKYKTPSAS